MQKKIRNKYLEEKVRMEPMDKIMETCMSFSTYESNSNRSFQRKVNQVKDNSKNGRGRPNKT
jgi:hypothetical protein